MDKTTTDLPAVAIVGLDLAKYVFQVHAVDAAGRVVMSRALRRKDVLAFFERLPSCLIGMEACGSAHHWARQLMKLGHDVRLMSPFYVKAYVRRQKNDAADAAAICEAVTWPSMRFVPADRSRTRLRSCTIRCANCWWPSARSFSMRCAAMWPRSGSSPRRDRQCPRPGGPHHGRQRHDPGDRALGAVASGAPAE